MEGPTPTPPAKEGPPRWPLYVIGGLMLIGFIVLTAEALPLVLRTAVPCVDPGRDYVDLEAAGTRSSLPAMGLSIMVPNNGTFIMEDGTARMTPTSQELRFGTNWVTIGPITEARPSSAGDLDVAVTLPNGGLLRYRTDERLDYRVVEGFLRGELVLDGTTYQVECRDAVEDRAMVPEGCMATRPFWCLPYLGTLRKETAIP